MKYLVTLELLEIYEVLVEAPDSDTASSVAQEIDLVDWKLAGQDTRDFRVEEAPENATAGVKWLDIHTRKGAN